MNTTPQQKLDATAVAGACVIALPTAAKAPVVNIRQRGRPPRCVVSQAVVAAYRNKRQATSTAATFEVFLAEVDKIQRHGIQVDWQWARAAIIGAASHLGYPSR